MRPHRRVKRRSSVVFSVVYIHPHQQLPRKVSLQVEPNAGDGWSVALVLQCEAHLERSTRPFSDFRYISGEANILCQRSPRWPY
jgi:hypothetical protein